MLAFRRLEFLERHGLARVRGLGRRFAESRHCYIVPTEVSWCCIMVSIVDHESVMTVTSCQCEK